MMLKFMGSAAISALMMGVSAIPVLAAPFDIYTDRTAWETALAGFAIVEDGFDNNIASAQSIVFDSGVVSTGSIAPTNPSINVVSGGSYNSNNDPDGSGGFPLTTWTFPDQIFAFGMDFIDAASNFGITVSGDFDGSGIVSFDIRSQLGRPGDGFLGIIGAGLFDQIMFTPTPNEYNSNEGYSIDNLAFVSPIAVPVPAGIWLMLTGLGALGVMRGTRRIGS